MKIREWFDKKRVFLYKYRVFFDVVSPIVMVVAIIIITIQTNKIALYHVKLIESEKIPILHFDINRFDKHPEIVEEVVVSNVGSPLQNFDCEDITFLEISCSEELWGRDRKGKRIVKWTQKEPNIAISECYRSTVIDVPKGKLATLQTTLRGGNLSKVNKVVRELKDLVRRKNPSIKIHDWDVKRYLRIKYETISGEIHDEIYFFVEWWQHVDCVKLPHSITDRIIEQHKSMIARKIQVDYQYLSAVSLYEKWLVAWHTTGAKDWSSLWLAEE